MPQARHPAHEVEAKPKVEPTPDPLGLADDDGDPGADSRAMRQAQALTVARAVYAIDAGDDHPGDLELGS